VVVLRVASPKPPPNWPTITSDVGILFGVELPDGVKERLFVRLIVRFCPVGTVMITGDHPVEGGFRGLHTAVEPFTAVPQLYPHIGTEVPSGMVAVVAPAVKLTCCWPRARAAPQTNTLASWMSADILYFVINGPSLVL
jgi:hypothetical protein